ncbi:MAG: hypothetical protein IID34_06145 [Planctomycetes bacterium]|nr:hypothetical protein [Planctomycetota bacterium]
MMCSIAQHSRDTAGGDLAAGDCGPGTVRLAGLHGRPRLSETPRPRGELPAALPGIAPWSS